MDCRMFERLLPELQADSLSPEVRRQADLHLAGCPSCRLLPDIVGGKVDLLPDAERQDLARSILESTSGSACGRARDLLCSFVDGALEPVDARLVALHLENCAICHELAANLIDAGELLPGMAGLEPDDLFAGQVIQATAARRPVHEEPLTRLRGWWDRLVRRPRFSFEAAYVGTLALVLFAGNPFPPMRALSVRALDFLAEAAPSGLRRPHAGALSALKPLAVELSNRELAVRQALERSRSRGEKLVTAAVDYQKRSIQSLWERGSRSVPGFWRSLRQDGRPRPTPKKAI